jgi:hypothetical protein
LFVFLSTDIGDIPYPKTWPKLNLVDAGDLRRVWVKLDTSGIGQYGDRVCIMPVKIAATNAEQGSFGALAARLGLEYRGIETTKTKSTRKYAGYIPGAMSEVQQQRMQHRIMLRLNRWIVGSFFGQSRRAKLVHAQKVAKHAHERRDWEDKHRKAEEEF